MECVEDSYRTSVRLNRKQLLTGSVRVVLTECIPYGLKPKQSSVLSQFESEADTVRVKTLFI